MDRTPASVGRYTVESVLGTGGTSTVYLARDADRVVALKVFHRGRAATRVLVHRNIVAVYEQGPSWLAMQYVPGTNADAELRAGRMPPSRAAHIITEIAAALDYAHAHGVVHGDVKPSNFLLADDDRVLLTDFGAAPFAEDGMVLVSAAYAAPEMLCGKDVDGRADVYSLGCSLFRLLTGKPPFFDAGSKDDVVRAHLHRQPPRVSAFAPWLPQAIDDVITTAMSKNPDTRYQTAGALAEAAGAALNLKG